MVNPAMLISLFKSLEKTGKQSKQLQGVFSSMVQASDVTEVYNVAMKMMQEQTTIACIDAIHTLVDIINDPDFEIVTEALAIAIDALAEAIKFCWEQVKPALTWLRLLGYAIDDTKDDLEDLDIRGDPSTAAERRHEEFQDVFD